MSLVLAPGFTWVDTWCVADCSRLSNTVFFQAAVDAEESRATKAENVLSGRVTTNANAISTANGKIAGLVTQNNAQQSDITKLQQTLPGLATKARQLSDLLFGCLCAFSTAPELN